jgi:hypothetical protein
LAEAIEPVGFSSKLGLIFCGISDSFAGFNALGASCAEAAADCRTRGVDLAELVCAEEGALLMERQRVELEGFILRGEIWLDPARFRLNPRLLLGIGSAGEDGKATATSATLRQQTKVRCDRLDGDRAIRKRRRDCV